MFLACSLTPQGAQFNLKSTGCPICQGFNSDTNDECLLERIKKYLYSLDLISPLNLRESEFESLYLSFDRNNLKKTFLSVNLGSTWRNFEWIEKLEQTQYFQTDES